MDNKRLEDIKKKLRMTNKELADMLGVEMRRLLKWTKGEQEIPLWAEKFLHILLGMRRGRE